jgi:hypothetical protein
VTLAQLTERDLQVLRFIAEHRLALAAHVRALLGASEAAVDRRLRELKVAGFVTRRNVFHRQPACYQITRDGLAVIGSRFPRPRLDLSCYAHDVGVAWLWLLARAGRLGPAVEVLSERRMRAQDRARDPHAEPLAVRLGGYGQRGAERLHYADLLLVSAQRRIAIELELTGKGRGRTERILMGYALDSRIDAVLYLVDRAALAESIERAARRAGIERQVHVQPFRLPVGDRREALGLVRAGGRAASVDAAERGAGARR